MKVGKKLLVLAATVAILLVAAVPAAAQRVETVDITIDNRTGSTVQISLNGPGETSKVFVGSAQDLEVAVEPGQYFYKYEACGRTNSGFYNAVDGAAALVLKKCSGVATSNIVVDNQTGSPFILTLSGMGGAFGFWVPPGGINISLPAGGYQFNSNACGDGSGTLKASASLNQPLIWTWDCAGGDEPTLAATGS